MNNNENQFVDNTTNNQPVNNTPQVDNQGQMNNNQQMNNQNQQPSSNDEVNNGKVMAILSYFGLLVLIPYFTEKNNSFVVFHAKQGLNLLILEVIAVFATSFIGSIIHFSYIASLVELGALVLSIIGIVYAAQGEKKELPVVSSIKFIK